MIYTIIGTDKALREKALLEVGKLGTATSHIYSEQISTLEPLISAGSLFGEKVIVVIIQAFDVAASKEEVIRLLPEMKKSENIFILDDPFGDANRVKMLAKYSTKLYDAREEKKKATDVFILCNLFGKRDKKGAWEEWVRIKDKETGEAIHGALWWKFQMVWGDVREGRPSKFTLSECEELGGTLALASIHAHSGKTDLKTEIERIILSL